MKKMARFLSAFVIAASVSCFAAASASAASLNEWQVYSENGGMVAGWVGNGSAMFSVDRKIHPEGSSYSIRLDNTDYNISYVEKAFRVEPDTTYRFSAKVKYSGYSLDPEAETEQSGACVGKAFSYQHSDFTTDSEWNTVEYFFDSGDETEWALCLQNGIYNAKCHGTAWFSDVKLEKAEYTNNWKVLTIIFRDINASDANGDGSDWVMASLSDEDIERAKKLIGGLATSKDSPNSMYNLSGGLMNINKSDIEFVVASEPATELAKYYYAGDKWGTGEINGNMLDPKGAKTKAVIDKLSAGKTYNQLIVVSPLGSKSGGWLGIGSAVGNNGGAFQYNFTSESKIEGSFPESALVHEMLHGMDQRSQNVDPATPQLHSNPDFGYDTNDPEQAREYYSLYMRKQLPGNKGLDPSVFMVPSGKYELVSDDMTAGRGISSETAVRDIADASYGGLITSYTGKPLQPDIPLMEAGYTLQKGVDYTVTYRSNTDIGTAYADVKGIGVYSGARTVEFTIAPALGKVNVKRSGNDLTVSWNKVEGASYYDLWQFDGEKYKLVRPKITSLSEKFAFKKDVTYGFAVAAYIPDLGKTTEYSYSDKFRVESKPQSFTVTRSGDKLTVGWSEVIGAKYTLMQSTDGGKYKAVVKNTDNMYAQVKVKSGHTYRFKVKAYIPSIKYTSSYAFSKSVKITDGIPKVSIKNDVNRITVSWKKVGNSKSYSVWESVDGGGYKLKLNGCKSTSLSMLVADDHTYSYAVAAYDPELNYTTGYGYSKPVKVDAIVQKVNAKKQGSKIVVSWSAVNGAKYSVWQTGDDGKFKQVISGTDKLSAEFSYKKGRSYQFAVIAYVEESGDFTEYSYTDVIK